MEMGKEGYSAMDAPAEGAKTVTEPGRGYRFAKRFFDVVLSAATLALLSPILLLIALLIRLDSPGPVIHKRWCEGKNGLYPMLKFRTMVEDADDLEKHLSPEQIEEYRRNIKRENDPRITRVGRLLRKMSLDELPQFVNVLRGEMSIIGPRPVVTEELALYGDAAEEILSVKPGITGYWQTSGRSQSTYESGERQEKELYYVRHQSLRLDMQIFFRTFTVVLSRSGAH